MEMSTADVFKRSINKLHVPFCFELQGVGIERGVLCVPDRDARLVDACLKFVAAAGQSMMFLVPRGIVEWRWAQSLITH